LVLLPPPCNFLKNFMVELEDEIIAEGMVIRESMREGVLA
jgi:hypothetical protein